MLTRDQILSTNDLPTEEVFVSEWNGSVFVRALTGGERHKLEKLFAKDGVTSATLVAMCVVDANGNRLFSDDDVTALGNKHGAALEKIVRATLRFNALSTEGLEEAGNV